MSNLVEEITYTIFLLFKITGQRIIALTLKIYAGRLKLPIIVARIRIVILIESKVYINFVVFTQMTWNSKYEIESEGKLLSSH